MNLAFIVQGDLFRLKWTHRNTSGMYGDYSDLI